MDVEEAESGGANIVNLILKMNKDTKAQRDPVTCPRSHSLQVRKTRGPEAQEVLKAGRDDP